MSQLEQQSGLFPQGPSQKANAGNFSACKWAQRKGKRRVIGNAEGTKELSNMAFTGLVMHERTRDSSGQVSKIGYECYEGVGATSPLLVKLWSTVPEGSSL